MLELEELPGLDDQQKVILRRAGLINPSEVLLPSPQDLSKRLKLSDVNQVHAIVKAVSRDMVPKVKTVAELLERDRERWMGTGDGDVDALLGGGIRRGSITEIAGESASGKSHFGLQLAVSSQLSTCSPTPGGAILLTSERKVSFTRLEELAQHSLSYAQQAPSTSTSTLPTSAKAMLDNVQTMHVTEVDGLEHALAYAVPAMIAQIAAKAEKQARANKVPQGSRALPVRLLIIDSIGALFRASFDSNHSGLTQRSKMLCLIADKLKALAEEHDLAVVVVNQVSDVFGRGFSSYVASHLSRHGSSEAPGSRGGSPPPIAHDEPTMTYKVQSRYFSGQTDMLAKEASLGLVWANAVNVRLMLSRTGRRRALDHSDLSRKRKRLNPYDRDVQAEQREERRVAASSNAGRGEAVQPLSQDPYNQEAFESTLIRRMHLIFSPFTAESTLDYVILESGIHSLTAPTRRQLPRAEKEVEVDGGESDEFAEGEFTDDLGDLPAEFWNGEAFKEARQEAVDRSKQRQAEEVEAAKLQEAAEEDMDEEGLLDALDAAEEVEPEPEPEADAEPEAEAVVAT